MLIVNHGVLVYYDRPLTWADMAWGERFFGWVS